VTLGYRGWFSQFDGAKFGAIFARFRRERQQNTSAEFIR
jgi:hypothetical protein